ncbi:AAA family ATPase [Thiothrix eikelboomii]|uniref:Predicted ATP-binding protein involved in virulence n=1 Tax=Thiothrix eikelboomii TaxID=92487 RepID=A0A1T4Y141_9GAMM|nr:AAA family ATPase [Thiothrix eikelboomii]SKA95011.1 Predicted ATP-binding protein involved in virulence [Thiothrix eikelboomii]
MILKTLRLKNFRRFENLSIDFHDELTVIVARNGQGKTTLLDAVTIALGTFVGAFDLGKGKGIDRSDARYVRTTERVSSEQRYPVEIMANFSKPKMDVLRQLMGAKNKTTTKDASELTEYGKQLQALMRELSDDPLPVVAYYSTGRLWKAHKDMSRKAVLSESRAMGYEDCLSSASSFVQIQQWMTKATLGVRQQEEIPGYEQSNLPAQVDNIKVTVEHLLAEEGWRNFHYSFQHEELAMSHPDHGILPVSLLSDGVRAMISLTADLAWRCTKLNPQFGRDASVKSPGIVMIDEVDMHLHPQWQQRVIASLRRAFPNIQLIVTTHSPQVLSTVHRENIRLLGTNEAGQMTVSEPLADSYGEPSNDVLQAIMHVDPQPPVPEKAQLERLTELVDQGLSDDTEAQRLLAALKQSLSPHHPQLEKVERSIRRQRVLGR